MRALPFHTVSASIAHWLVFNVLFFSTALPGRSDSGSGLALALYNFARSSCRFELSSWCGYLLKLWYQYTHSGFNEGRISLSVEKHLP